MEPTHILFQQLGISLLLGLLVGLQREHAVSRMAGMRTFPLITVLGTMTAFLAGQFGGWIVAAGFLGVVAVISVAHLLKIRQTDPTIGTTTDMAMLLMFAVGAFLTVEGAMPVAIAVGGGVAVLLQFKPELHRFVAKLGDADLKAIMQFVLITCIILPVLPNQTYGPSDIFHHAGMEAAAGQAAEPAETADPLKVFNPRQTWLMVVLIVGMSLGGYIVYKFLGRDAGILLGGVLGGSISSTATTVSYSRSARGHDLNIRSAAIVIMIASTIVYARVLIEIAVVSRGFLRTTVAPVAILMALTLVPALVMWFRVRKIPANMPEQGNPTQLKSALMFGVMYAVVLFALAAAKQQYFGSEGLYIVAVLSGSTDMDAITLSTARMSLSDDQILAAGWRLIVVGALANLVLKAGIAGILGGRRLLVQIAILFSVPMIGGILLLALWPTA